MPTPVLVQPADDGHGIRLRGGFQVTPGATYRVCLVRGRDALIKREQDGTANTCYWIRMRARHPGTCAATGQPIALRDLVYRPAGDVPYRAERLAASYVETPEGDPRP